MSGIQREMMEKTAGTLLGIAAVSQLTGISQHLLRSWERRYQAVDTERATNGRRMYSPNNVERLIMIKHLVDRGESVGKIAQLDTADLKELIGELDRQSSSRERLQETPLRVAVLGYYLTARFEKQDELPANIEVVACSASIANFKADIRRLQPNALIIEAPTLLVSMEDLVRELIDASGADRVAVTYGFGRREHVRSLQQLGVHTAQTPINPRELLSLLSSAPLRLAEPKKKAKPQPKDIEGAPMEVPGRLFDEQELARLAGASSTLECECPNHIVDIVLSLTAFEAYSAACESRDTKDAELHAYLHMVTASVRARMERALERVARKEGLI
ncbi:MAG: DNA-binding transcriptional MerR regulator [Pseudohongiellaceae bacterium]